MDALEMLISHSGSGIDRPPATSQPAPSARHRVRFSKRPTMEADPSPTLRRIGQAAANLYRDSGALDPSVVLHIAAPLHADMQLVLSELHALGLDPAQAWVLVVQWINDRPGGLGDSELRHALADSLASIPERLIRGGQAVIRKHLGVHGQDTWQRAPVINGCTEVD